MWIKTNDDDRVIAASMTKADIGDDAVQVVKPDDWDWGQPMDWVLTDGALMHEPVVDGVQVSEIDTALMELAEMTADNAARLDEQDAALMELASIIAGGE